ncbi:hypothetical protein CVT26_012685 [Gymnopilus dilepis]|uniref:Uncharacterized protein n=1 Tax=Gymnopilus dilepis TaxID=231916 RepID=A0A409WAP4_9AGAR|nr:hypothetical protein CVT26_012685 [Gymnopilus dilepis]
MTSSHFAVVDLHSTTAPPSFYCTNEITTANFVFHEVFTSVPSSQSEEKVHPQIQSQLDPNPLPPLRPPVYYPRQSLLRPPSAIAPSASSSTTSRINDPVSGIIRLRLPNPSSNDPSAFGVELKPNCYGYHAAWEVKGSEGEGEEVGNGASRKTCKIKFWKRAEIELAIQVLRIDSLVGGEHQRARDSVVALGGDHGGRCCNDGSNEGDEDSGSVFWGIWTSARFVEPVKDLEY